MKNKRTSRLQSESIYSNTEVIVKKKVGKGRDEEERGSTFDVPDIKVRCDRKVVEKCWHYADAQAQA